MLIMQRVPFGGTLRYQTFQLSADTCTPFILISVTLIDKKASICRTVPFLFVSLVPNDLVKALSC